jgi:uncharacterized glyoxalase superfamily protein PhnB
MNFASVRLVTADVDRLITFYGNLTGVAPTRFAPDFAQLTLPGGATLAISSERLIAQFNASAAIAGANRSAIIEFQVDHVDAEHKRLGDSVETVMAPANMPWGNRSMLLRDPDGNVVNIFARPRTA